MIRNQYGYLNIFGVLCIGYPPWSDLLIQQFELVGLFNMTTLYMFIVCNFFLFDYISIIFFIFFIHIYAYASMYNFCSETTMIWFSWFLFMPASEFVWKKKCTAIFWMNYVIHAWTSDMASPFEAFKLHEETNFVSLTISRTWFLHWLESTRKISNYFYMSKG